ncbi:MAG: putative alcohol dehydrogenase [Fibrobacteres bacterium]|nr:putative alcohol dehydrogenase [Fibrobacterota bacterium]
MVLESGSPAGPGRLIPREIPEPVPGPGEIRLKVLACGVCRTDLHLVSGDLEPGKPDLVPGHQAVGRVDAVGPGAEGFRVGDTAGATWLYLTCGRCIYCVTGRENLCDRIRFTGMHADGGYAEAMVIPATHAVPLPEGLSAPDTAPLLCAGVIGYRSLKLSGVLPGQILGLFGFGASAHITLQIALRMGCRICVFSRDDAHRRHALSLGAAWAGRLEDNPPEPLHGAITFAPSGRVAVEALRKLRKGGTVAVNAVHMDTLPAFPYSSLYQERCIRSVANITREDIREFMALAAAGPFRVKINPFPLAEANIALARMLASDFQGAAVLLIPGAA